MAPRKLEMTYMAHVYGSYYMPIGLCPSWLPGELSTTTIVLSQALFPQIKGNRSSRPQGHFLNPNSTTPHPPPTYRYYIILSLAPILLFSYQNSLSRKGLNSFTLLVKFNGSLKVSYDFHFTIESRCVKIWRSKGEIIRNKSKELFSFPLHVLSPTSLCPQVVVEREIGLGGKDETDDRHSLIWNRLHSTYMSWWCFHNQEAKSLSLCPWWNPS